MNETVLIIDDSKFLRRYNELAVAKSGYTVLVAADGEEGLDLARTSIPDVIVLDMMLPKLSGPELLSALKQDSLTSQIPVIVLSGLPQSNEAKLKKAGAAFYLQKSDDKTAPAVLVQVIEMILRSAPATVRQPGLNQRTD